MFLKGFAFESDREAPRKYFSQEIINSYTVKYFNFIQMQMKDTRLEEHLKAVKEYLGENTHILPNP